VTAGESSLLHQRAGNPAPSLRGVKENLHHSNKPARGNISSTPLSEGKLLEHQEKKNKNPDNRGTRD
jgi:hypothetical protein